MWQLLFTPFTVRECHLLFDRQLIIFITLSDSILTTNFCVWDWIRRTVWLTFSFIININLYKDRLIMKMSSYPFPYLPWWPSSRQQRGPDQSRDTSSTWPPGWPGRGRPPRPWPMFWRTCREPQLIDTITNFLSSKRNTQSDIFFLLQYFHSPLSRLGSKSLKTHTYTFPPHRESRRFHLFEWEGKASVICNRPSAHNCAARVVAAIQTLLQNKFPPLLNALSLSRI